MLAVTFGLEIFNYYTYGRDTYIITDYKLFESMVLKPLCEAPNRLQSLLLRANHYNFTLRCQSGKSIPAADRLPPAPLRDKPVEELVSVNNLSLIGIKDDRLDFITLCYTM